jgi:DNA polymerase III epsilon subunit-like protein
MNAIVFDCETNGKPKNWRLPMHYVSNWPRVTQLAWQRIDIYTGEVINQHVSLIKPDGWEVPKEQFFIDHNMSTERCEAEGKPIAEVLDLLISDMNEARILVAHNLNFDNNVVGAEMIRLKVRAKQQLKKVCTMMETTDFCGLPGQYGRPKWPQLKELHEILFNCGFDGAHDAMADVDATAKCFVELIKRGVIKV